MKKFWMVFFLIALLLSACDAEKEGVEVHDPWASPAVQGETGSLYLLLHNHSAKDDELIGASSDIAERLEFQEDMEGMEMPPLDSLIISSGGEIDFAALSLRIALVNLKRDLKVGDSFEVTLHFKIHKDIVMTVPVLEFAAPHDEDH